jgi:hypothetical protein
MLGTWHPHTQYQTHTLKKLKRLLKTNPKSIQDFTTSILKMWCMDLDTMQPIVEPLFSVTGRPSNRQPEIMRLFMLMIDQGERDIDKWLKTVAATPLFCAIAGLEPYELPGASTLRDFISRLWQEDTPNPLKPPVFKPKEKFGNHKQPPKRPGIIADLCRQAKKGEIFSGVPESFLQAIFTQIALKPSALIGLLGDTHKIKASADGACVESHANPNGHKACDCKGRCDCNRRFADPEAKWGWDSYHKRSFFGYTMYALSTHNTALKLDLPLYLRFVDASQFDGVSLIQAFAHARHIYQGFLDFNALLADSAHDNYPTYDLLRHFKVRPFIDLNPRSNGESAKPQNIQLSKNGLPICPDGHEMVNWGFDKNKFRTKFRAPCVVGNVSYCPYSDICCPTLYGKIVYLRHADDLRFNPPVPRGSPAWKAVYNQRTAAERVNNRILTDYRLEQPMRRGKKNLTFFAFLNAINIHLDAIAKFGGINLNTLLA